MRQIVLDTETTGLEPKQGHRIIEIGCVELVDRKLTGRHYHQYINPQREIDEGAMAVHGISNEFLADKPLFSAIFEDFWSFLKGAELVIHNAPFDVGFINSELARLGRHNVETECTVLDTLVLARQKHPGQKNNLDALCKRYGADNSQRDLHGALLDAEILADVYLLMTGGQTALELAGETAINPNSASNSATALKLVRSGAPLPVIRANSQELSAHESTLSAIDKKSDGQCVWLGLDSKSPQPV